MSWFTGCLALVLIVKLVCQGVPATKVHLVRNVNAKQFDVVAQHSKLLILLQCFG